MPIYEYRCMDCDKTSEIFLRNPDSESIKCPACGSGNLERLLSASYNIRMKGFTPSRTCCGRMERCETPPCSSDGICRRDS